MKAIDLSAPSIGRVVEHIEFEPFIDDGYELLIVGLHGGRLNPYARETLINARSTGLLHTAGYIFLWPDMWGQQITEAKEHCAEEWDHLQFVCADAEWPAEAFQEHDGPEVLTGAVSALEGTGANVWFYSGHWWWSQFLPECRDFAQYPLWDSDYTGVPNLQMARQYGGWTHRSGHQFQGTTDLHGLTVDLNWFDREAVLGKEATMPILTDIQMQAVASHFNLAVGTGIADSWVAEAQAGRYYGMPLGGEEYINTPDGQVTIMRFERGVATYVPGKSVSWVF
jgi:hypothetical protein|tara:strand:- start:3269 stop:4114 length:846 start_codon:yes stop_codon:yes gene_type:complete